MCYLSCYMLHYISDYSELVYFENFEAVLILWTGTEAQGISAEDYYEL